MLYKFKNIKNRLTLIFAVVLLSSTASGFDYRNEREMATILSDMYFIYPSKFIEYFVSGSSLIDFILSSKVEVEKLQIIESLAIRFDKTINDGLGYFVSN